MEGREQGGQLGEGEFSIVSEITQFKVQEECNCIFHGGLDQSEGDLGAGTPKDVIDDERLAFELGCFGLEDDADLHDDALHFGPITTAMEAQVLLNMLCERPDGSLMHGFLR